MADDINLPNLVSHLAVNLDGVSGAIGDASRQGSAMGSALGQGINRQLDDLLRNLPQVTIDGDSDPLDRDLARVHRQLAQLDSQRIGVDVSVGDALRQLEDLETNLQRIGDQHPNVNVRAATAAAARQLEELRQAARQVDDTDVHIDVDVDEDRPNRLTGILSRIPAVAGSAAGAIGGIGKAAAGLGAAVPVVAGLASTLANVAPAAGVAVTGMMSVALAQGTVKLAAVGMDDALSAALDPSKTEEFSEALEKLSPSAQKFATAVRDISPQLRSMQQAVQEEVFRGLGANLERTAKSVLPVLRTNLLSSATAIGDMAAGAMGAARELADNGTLGKALGSASKGLQNMSGIPGVVVTALGQIGAAAGPSFERLTSAAADSAAGIGERLGKAFESGAMQDAIETAIDLIKDLADIAGNVGQIIGGIFKAVPEGGGGLVGTLQQVTQAIADVVNTPEVQGGLRAIFETMSTLASTVAPLLAQALKAIGPVFEALGPPAQTLIEALGDALSPIIEALGPVLVVAAQAVGALVEALSPLLPVIGELAAALLPALTPLLDAVVTVFQALAPVVGTLAGILQETLAPILAELPAIITPLADLLANNLSTWLTIIGDLLVELAPSFVQLGTSAAELMVALGPLITAVAGLVAQLAEALMPVIQPIIGLIGGLASILSGKLAAVISNVVVPVLTVITQLLSGDFSGAWRTAKEGVGQAAEFISQKAGEIGRWVGEAVGKAVEWLRGLPGRAMTALSTLGSTLSTVVTGAGRTMVTAISGKVTDAVDKVRGLPGKAKTALGNLAGTLASAGRDLIAGFISGITSKISDVQSTLSSLTSKLTDWKGPPKKDAKILTPAGRLLIEGFIKGIDGTTAKLRSKLASITKALPANVRSGYGKTLKKAISELEKLTTKRDAVIKKLAAGQKKLDDLLKARSKAAGDITKGILDEADITTGYADVNSVSAITVGLQQALKKTTEFQKNIAKLKKAGLRSDLLQQIADAGVEAGGATAAALARATPAELKRINTLQAQLARSAKSTGDTVGDALYSAGIRAAQGLVAGLKSQEKTIEKQMAKIATSMLKTVKKKHKTKSPSQAFRWIGEMDGRGLEVGLLATVGRVRAAARTVAGAALDVATGVGGALAVTPTAGQLATVTAGAVGGRGDQYNTIHLHGTQATPDEMLRALSWRGLVGRR
ncbi:hypothetical protein DIZ27_23075 [Streptomyces sp. NWU339]|uniref:hypothetical protein n=1 Tax=Streptomyces sp. NWU339 TaxID=2185284 RepID=UPI000D683159|nr:hypothetical protein [Streptomyces sp. NWU339]PWI08324.1 hypothetical protein DIZ27_23075 [Streptomyces sp. NWU339]